MKKKTKRIIALSCIAAVVILLAAMPLLARKESEEDGPKASILSGNVSVGSINKEVIGGGTLAQEDAVAISVPTAVKLKEFLVTNGESVTQGTAVATVDRVTVMQAITQVQETLEYLSEKIEQASEITEKENVTALAGGTVKMLYAQKGDSVQQVMLEHGALAVLSLDGLMAVDLKTESTLPSGTVVKVVFAEGQAAEGKILKNLAGEITVTLPDNDYAVDQTVEVTDKQGEKLGSGELYIYSPWNATAYAGTVDSVKVSVGDKLSAGKTLLTLSDVGYSAGYRQLIGQRQEYEELMLQLFQMYQTETVTAPCDGVVSGIDKNSVQLLSQKEKGAQIHLLANAPNGDDETLYSNYLGKVTTVAQNGWVLQVTPESMPIADYKELMGMVPDENLMTETVLFTQTQIPVFTLTEGQWTSVNPRTISSGDILLFAADGEGELVWSVLVQKAAQTPGTPGGSQQPNTPSGNNNNNRPNFNGDFGDMGGMQEQEPEFQMYALDMTEIAQVTAQNTVTLDITVDELDIKVLQLGMTAQVKIDALGGEKYTATITEIGNTGTNNGGSSKFTVELTLERAENMLSGMNATATIVLDTVTDVLTIPAAALEEQETKTVVYTGYDEKTETLINPVVVKVGNSDGETVEILEGLVQGQTYYYAYYDTLEISAAPDFGSGGFPGR